MRISYSKYLNVPLLFLCIMFIAGCGYTVIDNQETQEQNDNDEYSGITRESVRSREKHVVFKFEFRFRDRTLNTFDWTLSGAFPYGHSGTHPFKPDQDMTNRILYALELTDYQNYNFYPKYPDKREDRFLYFEINGERASLRWRIFQPANENEKQLKIVEDLINEMIETSAIYKILNRPDPPPRPHPYPHPIPHPHPHPHPVPPPEPVPPSEPEPHPKPGPRNPIPGDRL